MWLLSLLFALYAEAPFAVGRRFVASYGLAVLGRDSCHHVKHYGIGGRLGERSHRRIYRKCGVRRGEFTGHFPNGLMRSVFPAHWEFAVWRLDKSGCGNMPRLLSVDEADCWAIDFSWREQFYASDVESGFRASTKGKVDVYCLVFCQLQFHDKTYFSKLCATRACRL